MKVLMISEYFYPEERGGGEISAFLLAKNLATSGVETHILTSHFCGLKKIEIKDRVTIHRLLKTGKNPSKVKDMLERYLYFEKSLLENIISLNKKQNFDIIHCMNATSIPAVKIKPKIKKPFVLHVNSPVLFCPKGTLMYKDKWICEKKCTFGTFLGCYMHSKLMGKSELAPLLKYNPAVPFAVRERYVNYSRLIKEFDHFIAISNFMKQRLIFAGILEKKVSVVYNIVELGRFRNLKQPKNKVPKILYLGEFSKPKGVHLLVEALKNVKLPYEANFYGDGTLRNQLIWESEGYNIYIHESIPYEKVPQVMEKHDIVVFPSIVAEAFGRVVLEAAAAGKIVVSSRVGGVTEIIKEKKGTFFFNPGFIPPSLIESAIKSCGKLKKIKFAQKAYSSREIINIYKKLVK